MKWHFFYILRTKFTHIRKWAQISETFINPKTTDYYFFYASFYNNGIFPLLIFDTEKIGEKQIQFDSSFVDEC